jgi:hypothetical protein
MDKKHIIEKIMSKKEYSQLPKKDVELVFGKFEKRQTSDEEKIKLSRDLLRKIYSSFSSGKLLSIKDKKEDWILKKHLSTRERLSYYSELYKKLLGEFGTLRAYSETFPSEKFTGSIIDLGAGVNGFSYKYFQEENLNVNYVGVEAVGQLATLMEFYFMKNKLKAKAIHESLFELEKIKKIILKTKKPRVVFLFKVIDSLEMLERDYSKKLLKEIVPLVDKVVISFATESFVKRQKFKVKRNWILDFIKDNFKILEDFQLGPEKYISFSNG